MRSPEKTIWLVAFFLILSGGYAELVELGQQWLTRDTFGYGLVLGPVAVWLIATTWPALNRCGFDAPRTGIGVLLFSGLLVILGRESATAALVQYGLMGQLAGLALLRWGWCGLSLLLRPFLLFILTIPPPYLLETGLNHLLLNASTELGVILIRLIDLPVHLSGDILDLGAFQLRVVEACGGLNSFFPLTAVALLLTQFTNNRLAQVGILFSALPVTVLTNGGRLALTAALFNLSDNETVRTVSHDTGGWLSLGMGIVILVAETHIINKFWPVRRSLRNSASKKNRHSFGTRHAGVALLLITVFVGMSLTLRQQTIRTPSRQSLATLPQKLSVWWGEDVPVDRIMMAKLNPDEWINRRYLSDQGDIIHLYGIYASDLRQATAVHSPRHCLPAGGWSIIEHQQKQLGIGAGLTVNRTIVQQGMHRQLVYYWFIGRGRSIAGDIIMKWSLFQDVLLRGRAEGGLIRIITDANDQADDLILDFIGHLEPTLSNHFPN
ncbi:MAG: EpsI family protein [Magnetococcales bacterium]|nr:EpsI family protein [Magnetococcales bacterium]